MSYGKMPPQAYTKETLQEAFEWWSEQPEELRNQIQDKDDLVGYYLRINRGEEPPKNEGGFSKAAKESFSSELKGLVKNLDAFEGYEGKGPKPQEKPKPQRSFEPAPKAQVPGVATKAPAQTFEPRMPAHVFEPSRQMQFPEMSKPLVPTVVEGAQAPKPQSSLVTTESKGQFFRLDERSKDSVARARELLNLSSDEEALRALIALGGAKIKGLI